MCNIGDVHVKQPVAVGEALDVHGVIEVARGFAIDGDNRQVTEIFAARAVGFAEGRGPMFRFLHDFRGKKMWQEVLPNDDFGVDTEVARAAKNLDHAATRSGAAPGIAD